MSRESGASDGSESAGRDLWPSGARDVPKLRGEVVGGDRESVVIQSGATSVSVTDVTGIDDLDGDEGQVVVYIKGTRLAIRLNDHANGTSAPALPADSSDRAMDRVMRSDQPVALPHSTATGPSVEIVRRPDMSPALNSNDPYVRKAELRVPWQDSPIELWTSAAHEAEEAPATGSPVARPADDGHRVTPLRIVPPVPAQSDNPSTASAEPSQARSADADTREEIHGDETGEPVRFRSVWDTPIWQDDPGPDNEEPPVDVRIHGHDRDADSWDEPFGPPLPDVMPSAPPAADDAIAGLRPNRTKRMVKRVATGALVAAMLAGALYGGSIVGARLIGDGNPPEQAGPPVAPDVVIRNVADTGDATVSRFNVEGAWTINWSSAGTGPFQVVAIDSEGSRTTVVDATGPDSGAARVDQTGVFSLEVVAEGEWRLAVLQQSDQG